MVIKTVNGKKLDIKLHEIRYRLKEPWKFDANSFRRKKITEGVALVLGCPEGHFSKNKCHVGTQTQAYRFDRKKFTPSEAAKWIERNKR